MLLKRQPSGIYYYRWQLPPDLASILNQKELIKSLGTRDKLEALCLSRELIYLKTEILKLRRQPLQSNNSNELVNQIKLLWQQYKSQEKEKQLPYKSYQSLALSQAWALFVKEMTNPVSGKWSNTRAIKTRHAHFHDFLEILGENKSVDEISREDAKQYITALLNFPSHRVKRFGNTPIKEIPKNVETISKTTINERKNTISALFRWLVNEEYLQKNPFEAITVEVNKISYTTYTNHELSLLFSKAKIHYKHPWQYWIPRIALTTGARQNEIAQLLTSDVKFDDQSKIHFFSINDEAQKSLKTKAAARLVPVPDCLIEQGFLEYVEALENNQISESNPRTDSLWPQLKPKAGNLGQRVSEWWAIETKAISLKSNTRNKERKVFHSLRRTFINTAIHQGENLEKIQTIVGHEPSRMKQTRVYFDGYPLNQLKALIDRLDFPIFDKTAPSSLED